MKVFSFCLYGTEPNYYTGLLENIKLIREFFPEFEIFVYRGVCDPTWVLPEGVTVIETHCEGTMNTIYRYRPLQTAEVGFVRDTDSRITERDRWAIRDFLECPQSYHMIRDHIWHKSRLMAGMFGWKKPIAFEIKTPADLSYGCDEVFLASTVYPLIASDLLVHTNLYAFPGEHSRRLPEMKDPTDFVGNVIWNGVPRFTSTPNLVEVVSTLQNHDQHALVKWLTDPVAPRSIPYEKRCEFFITAYIANYYLGDIAKAQEWLAQFEFAEITPNIHANGNFLLRRLGRLIASFDSTAEPNEGEVMLYYGQYPDGHLSLPWSNKIYRHVSRFFEVQHDAVLSHPVWEPVDCIYILNLEERVDRYYDTLLALAAVKAPLHRIHHYKAQRDGLPPYVGATKNHVDALDHFCKSGAKQALILEDDFVFLDDRERVWSTLARFWETSPSYDLCFLSLSKHGRREPHTDCTLQSFQGCTTSSGYFVRKDTAPMVLAVAREGLERMQETGDHHTYCIDRYWSKMPTILCLRPKLGFQRPSYSNLIRSVSAHLD